MISIRNSVDQLDRLENLRRAMADCFGLAIQSSAEYAVEVDAAQAALFRQRLNTVGERWRAADDPGELRLIGSSFRGELREYHRAAEQSLIILRREVEAAIAAFAGGVASQGADHEEQLKRELERLSNAAKSDDIAQIRTANQIAISQIHTALEQVRFANRMTIAQLQDEIRLLHHEIDADRHRPANPASLLRTRKQMEQRLNEALLKPAPFCVLLIAVRNWKSVIRKNSDAAAKTAIDEMISRLHSAIDPDLIVGRWSEDKFIALLRVEPATAVSISREAASKLSGTYEIEENGERDTVEFEVTSGIIDRASGSGSPECWSNLATLASELSAA